MDKKRGVAQPYLKKCLEVGYAHGMSSHAQLGEIRRANRRTALDAAYSFAGSFSLSDLVEVTGLSRPTLTQSMRLFEQAGLFVSRASRPAAGVGRSFALFDPIDRHHRFLVIVVGYSEFVVAIADVFGQWVACEREPMGDSDFPARIASDFPARIGRAVERLVADSPAPILGAVIAVMGIVRGGAVLKSNRYPILEAPESLSAMVAPVVDRWPQVDIVVRNDAKLAAGHLVSEALERGERASSAVALHMSQAAGCALVIDGRVLEGAHGAAGEVGLERGCAFYLAEQAVAAGAAELGLDWRDVFRAAGAGDLAALHRADEVARQLAHGVRPIILAMDPELVLVGGPVGDAGPWVADVMGQVLMGASLTPPTVLVLDDTADAVRLGALQVAVDRVRDALVSSVEESAIVPLADGASA